MDRVLLSVKRFCQSPSECALAAASSLANYLDPAVDYEYVRAMIPKRERNGGLYTSAQARLLNRLGFDVTIVTADLNLIDFTWADFSKNGIIRRMKKLRAYYRKTQDPNIDYVDDMIKLLEDKDYNNQLIIDYEFKKHIQRHLKKGYPVGASINWTSFFKFSKEFKKHKDDIKGEDCHHAIVIRGYDEKGVFIVDSHTEAYKGKWAKYKSGRYKVAWDKFLVNIPGGDLVLI